MPDLKINLDHSQEMDSHKSLERAFDPYAYMGWGLFNYGDGMIIAVSDVHLGWSRSDVVTFKDFLHEIVDSEPVEHVILVGDIFDMWRRDPEKLLQEYTEILEHLKELSKKKSIHYVVGNHDYCMIEKKDHMKNTYNLSISKNFLLTCGDKKYYFIHGYQFDAPGAVDTYERFANIICKGNDTVGTGPEELWKYFTSKVSFLERLRAQANGFRKHLISPQERISEEYAEKIKDRASEKLDTFTEDTYLVYGHTHRPYVDAKNRLVNTGSWVERDDSVPWNTYIEIIDGECPRKVNYSR